MDAIRLFPMVQPSGYPDKTDAHERRVEKHQEERRAIQEQKKVQDKIEDIAFELYVKKAEQNKLTLEIFKNRRLDLYV